MVTHLIASEKFVVHAAGIATENLLASAAIYDFNSPVIDRRYPRVYLRLLSAITVQREIVQLRQTLKIFGGYTRVVRIHNEQFHLTRTNRDHGAVDESFGKHLDGSLKQILAK